MARDSGDRPIVSTPAAIAESRVKAAAARSVVPPSRDTIRSHELPIPSTMTAAMDSDDACCLTGFQLAATAAIQ